MQKITSAKLTSKQPPGAFDAENPDVETPGKGSPNYFALIFQVKTKESKRLVHGEQLMHSPL